MNRVTTTDIANQLGLSRSTISKALNGSSKVDERTRLIVQQTANEMGYANIKAKFSAPTLNKTLSIVVQDNLHSDPYWSVFTKGFGDEAVNMNFRYTVNVISVEEEAELLLPRGFSGDPLMGLVTIGPFSEAYYYKIKESNVPAVYVDITRNICDSSIFGDTLFVCNREHTYEMTSHLIAAGHQRLGFVSADVDCRSFHERWLGFRDALVSADLPIMNDFNYGFVDGEVFENIRQWVSSLKGFPTAFVCVNDFCALTVKSSLNEVGLKVPNDIALCGFDNDRRLAALYPELTTADSCAEYMGKRAMQQLFWRLNNLDAPYETIKVASSVCYRNSTEGWGLI